MPASTDWETLQPVSRKRARAASKIQQPRLSGLVENGKSTGDL
jgi:hypothetical protein